MWKHPGALRKNSRSTKVTTNQQLWSSNWCGSPVSSILKILLEAVVDLQEAWIPLRAIGTDGPAAGLQRVPAQGVQGYVPHGQTHPKASTSTHLQPHWGGLAGRLGGPGAGTRVPPTVAVARDARIRRGCAFDEVVPAPVARLFVFLNVEVDCEDSHRLGHNEGKCAKVEGPAVVVLVLAVLVFLVAGIARVAGDVDDDSDDVAQAWRRRGQWQMVTGLQDWIL